MKNGLDDQIWFLYLIAWMDYFLQLSDYMTPVGSISQIAPKQL